MGRYCHRLKSRHNYCFMFITIIIDEKVLIMKHFLVTGALGYIGSKFISLLNDEYYNLKLTLADNISTSRFAPVIHLNETIEYDFIEMNLLNMQLDKIYPAIDCVIHLASNSTDNDSTFFGSLCLDRW